MIKLDIVIPVYNEDKNIVRLLETLENEIACNFRVLICYDRDNDTTLKKLKNKKKNEKIKVYFEKKRKKWRVAIF